MLKAKKLNRVVRIPDEKIGEYKELGYSIYDVDGKAIYEPQDDKQRIAELEKENAELKKQIASISKPKRTKTQAAETVKAETE